MTSYLLYHTSLIPGAEDGEDENEDEDDEDRDDQQQQQEEEGDEQEVERLIRENPQILADALNHQCRTQ